MKSVLPETITSFARGYKHAFEELFNCEDVFLAKFAAVFVFIFLWPLVFLSLLFLTVWLLISHPLVVLLIGVLVSATWVLTHLLDAYYKSTKKK